MWQCAMCTYRNNADSSQECEVCDGPRPDDDGDGAAPQDQRERPSLALPGGKDSQAAAAAGPASAKAAPKRSFESVQQQRTQQQTQQQTAAANPRRQKKKNKAEPEEEEEEEEEPLSEQDMAWCAAANSAFFALIQLAVLFHVRHAPLFLRSIADTVSQQNSGQPFDEVTARAFARISPRQISLRHEANAQEGQLGTAELRVVVRFDHGDPDGPAADPVAKRSRASSSLEPSRSGGLPPQQRWRNAGLAGGGGGGGWSSKTSGAGLEQLVIAAKVEFARRCQAYALLRRKEGRGLPRLHENDQTQAPSVFAPPPAGAGGAAAGDAAAAVAAGAGSGSWGKGEKVTAVNVLEYLKTTDDYNGQLVHIEPVAAVRSRRTKRLLSFAMLSAFAQRSP